MEIVVPDEFAYLYRDAGPGTIVKVPAAVLRKKADPITRLANRHRLLGENMIRVMKAAHGIGLAAPQLGVSERIVVIAAEGKPLLLFNPVIVERHGSQVAEEGCLSIPGLYGDVERATTIEIEGYGRKGRPMAYELKGLSARVAQHEVDHLDGILFTDKVDPATLHWSHPAHHEGPAE